MPKNFKTTSVFKLIINFQGFFTGCRKLIQIKNYFKSRKYKCVNCNHAAEKLAAASIDKPGHFNIKPWFLIPATRANNVACVPTPGGGHPELREWNLHWMDVLIFKWDTELLLLELLSICMWCQASWYLLIIWP